MDDKSIVDMFCLRNQEAIKQCELKYKKELKAFCKRITGSDEDAEECVNDTFMSAWNTVADVRPSNLRAYLYKLARNIAIDKQRHKAAKKRKSGALIALSELEGCLCDVRSEDFNSLDISKAMDEWLSGLEASKRIIFVKRYFMMLTVGEIAYELNLNINTVATTLFRLRNDLRRHLKNYGFDI